MSSQITFDQWSAEHQRLQDRYNRFQQARDDVARMIVRRAIPDLIRPGPGRPATSGMAKRYRRLDALFRRALDRALQHGRSFTQRGTVMVKDQPEAGAA